MASIAYATEQPTFRYRVVPFLVGEGPSAWVRWHALEEETGHFVPGIEGTTAESVRRLVQLDYPYFVEVAEGKAWGGD